jgi:hypothetical protein
MFGNDSTGIPMSCGFCFIAAYFCSVDSNALRRVNADAYSAASDIDDYQSNVVTDPDHLVLLSR